MREVHLQPPNPFDFKTPDDWPHWQRCFEHLRVASRLKEASASKQVNKLLYCLATEAESVLTSTDVTEDEQKHYTLVLDNFESFFQVCRNVIFKRARFNR